MGVDAKDVIPRRMEYNSGWAQFINWVHLPKILHLMLAHASGRDFNSLLGW